ncbi:MAG TPA: hypothetical protein VIZ86_04955 [Pseudomonas sp.]
MRRFAVGILIALILPLTACTIAGGDGGYRDYPRYGGHYPPPSDGHWRWDDDLRVYINVGYPYLYYHDHTYYRWHDNHWSSGSRFNGPWRVMEHRHVPSRLGQRHRSVQRYDDRRVPDRYWNNRDDRSDRRDYRDHRDYRDLRDYRGQSELQRRREALHERHDERGERRDLRQGQQWQQPRYERQDRQVQQQRFEQQRREIQQRSEGRQQPQWQRPREERRAQERGDERRHESRQLQQGGEPRQRNERRAVTQSNRQDGGHDRHSQSRPQQERQGGRQWEGRGER